MRVLIAPDKFKGTLTAIEVCRAIERGWRKIRPRDTLVSIPMSDGGDGFGVVLKSLLHAKERTVRTTNAAGEPRIARWWWVPKSSLAILETAQSNGLALLPQGRHHPFDLDTSGVAPLVLAAQKAGARHIIVGVGGSATNDAGFGVARALGWRFLDRNLQPILRWDQLHRLANVEGPASAPMIRRITVATDVANPLLGPSGATRVYGPQKGLQPGELAHAERCLRRLAEVLRSSIGIDSTIPGSGAAGGLGYGLRAFLGAESRMGFDIFAEHARLNSRLKWADLVITGEGSFDRQSVMGKGVGQWIRRCADFEKPVVVLAGVVNSDRHPPEVSRSLVFSRGLCDITSRDNALAHPAFWLRRLASDSALVLSAKFGTRTRLGSSRTLAPA